MPYTNTELRNEIEARETIFENVVEAREAFEQALCSIEEAQSALQLAVEASEGLTLESTRVRLLGDDRTADIDIGPLLKAKERIEGTESILSELGYDE